MKLTIERGLLLKVLTHIQSVVERRNTIPILSNVKFDAPDGNLSLNATDMDLDIVETVPADVAAQGQRRRRPTPCLILFGNYQMALRSSSTAQGEIILSFSVLVGRGSRSPVCRRRIFLFCPVATCHMSFP